MTYIRHINIKSLFLLIIVVFMVAACVLPRYTSASSYSVQANVPYPAPTVAAGFDSGFDGSTDHNAMLVLTGTCQMVAPSTIVSIWRSGASLGSTLCNSGLFSLRIILTTGQNLLTARSASTSGLYGPDSSIINVNLQLPSNPVVPPASTTGTPPTTSAQMNNAVNVGTLHNLSITTPQTFSALPDNNTVTLQVSVSGGNAPYTIMLNWGDGNTEAHETEAAGDYSYSHIYIKAGNYQVQAQARDVLGAYSVIYYQVVSYKVPSQTNPPKHAQTATNNNSSTFTPHIYYTVFVLLIFIILAAYAGYRAGLHEALNKRRTITASKKKKKK